MSTAVAERTDLADLVLPSRDDLAAMSGEERLASVVWLQQLRSRIDAALCDGLVVLEAEGDTERLTGLKTPQAIARAATCAPGTMKAFGSVGRKLDQWLPETKRLFSEGWCPSSTPR